MKRIGILLVLIVALFASCQTGPDIAPDNSGEITSTQADIAAGAATVAAGAGTLETQAADLADALGTLAQVNPSLAPVAAQAASHATAAKDHAGKARELEGSVVKARLEVVALMSRSAQLEGLYYEEHTGRVKAEGERNTARAILAGLAAIAGVLVFFKVKKLLF